VGKSYRDMDFLDRDEQINTEFFSDAEAISTEEVVRVAEVAENDLELSDEETNQETVSVRFDADGFAYASSDSDEPKPRRAKPTYSEPLELIPSKRAGLSQYGQDFAEVITRSQEFGEVSRINVIRWAHHGDGRRVSEKPSPCDFLCDVQIVARKVLSPTLYKIWKEIYFEGYGERAETLPIATQVLIQMRCGLGWRHAKLLPFPDYWKNPTPENRLGTAVDLMSRIEEEQRQEKNLALRRTKNKARRKARNARYAEKARAVAA
jgi:hypothetical protein